MGRRCSSISPARSPCATDRDLGYYRPFLRSLGRRLYRHFFLQGFRCRARCRSNSCRIPSATHQLHHARTPSRHAARRLHARWGIRDCRGLRCAMFAGTVILAALFFTVGGVFMKLSEGLTKFWPTVIVFALFLPGPALQTLAMKREDLAVTYLWVAGLESVLAFAFGVLLFRRVAPRLAFAGVLLITGGIVSLRSAY